MSPRKSCGQALRVHRLDALGAGGELDLLEQRLDLQARRRGSRATRRPGSRACWRARGCGRGAPSAARRRKRRRRCRRRAPRRPAARRCAPGSAPPCRAARRTNESTEPPFCAKPMKSSTLAEWPSRCAAIAITRADRDDAGAADAGDEQVVRPGPGVRRRQRQLVDERGEARRAPARRARPAASSAGRRRRRRSSGRSPWRTSSPCCSSTGRSCACGPARSRAADGDAVRLHRAVAAAFADAVVDEEAPRRIDELALLPAPALLGGAGLLVDQDRHARHLAQAPLHRVELGAVVELGAGREAVVDRVVLGDVVGEDDDLGRALGLDLARDARRPR